MGLKVSYMLAFGILCTVNDVITCFDQTFAIRAQKIFWHECLNLPSRVVQIKKDISFGDCMSRCVRISNCTGLNYWTNRLVCEILDVGEHDRGDADSLACVFVRREDIICNATTGVPSDSCNTSTVCEGPFCDIRSCVDLSVPYSIVHGNMRTVGARRKLECQNGSVSNQYLSYPVCQPDETWSDLLVCYDCPTLQNADNLLVGNLRLKVMSATVHTQAEATACCAEVGGNLARIDNGYTLNSVAQALQNNGHVINCLWVQGNYTGGFFRFDDGDHMPLLSWLWNIDAGKDACVCIDYTYRFNDKECIHQCGYLCELA